METGRLWRIVGHLYWDYAVQWDNVLYWGNILYLNCAVQWGTFYTGTLGVRCTMGHCFILGTILYWDTVDKLYNGALFYTGVSFYNLTL